MDYVRRQRQLRDRLDEIHTDVLFVTHLPNIRYLCGFTGSAGVLAIHAGKPVLFTDGRYTEQARDEVANARVAIGKAGAMSAAAQWARSGNRKTIGVEAQHTTLSMAAGWKGLLGAGFRLREVSGAVEKLRRI